MPARPRKPPLPQDATIPQTDDLLDDIVRFGAPSHIIKRVAKLIADAEVLADKRARDATRKAGKRAALSADIRGKRGQARTGADTPPPLDAPPSLPSGLPTLPPLNPPFPEVPPPAAPARGKTLCPESFEPSEAEIAKGLSIGLSRPAIAESAETMVAWSRGNGERRLDWRLAFLNWMRRDAAKARASPPAQRAGNGQKPNGAAELPKWEGPKNGRDKKPADAGVLRPGDGVH